MRFNKYINIHIIKVQCNSSCFCLKQKYKKKKKRKKNSKELSKKCLKEIKYKYENY